MANIRTVISGEKAAMSTISTVALGETDVLRRSGLETVGDVPWGTHFCQFYETANDLIDILAPYFKAGLGNNEFSMWVTSEPLSREEAENAMRKAVPDFAKFLKKGQMEIVPYGEWYLKDGAFDLHRVLDAWIGKLDEALAKGYDGIRVTGNTAWLEKKDWKDFVDYEEKVNSVIGKYRMIVVCTYSISKCGAAEVIDVIRNHQFALIRREGKWELVESSEIKQTKEALRASEEKFGRIYESASDAMVYLDKSGKILDVNKKAAELIGHSRDELKGLPLEKLDDEKYLPFAKKMYERNLRGDAPIPFEVEWRAKNGERIPIEVSSARVYYKGRPAVLRVARDIRNRKQMEEQRSRLGKLETMGELATMVAHDLRNPLTSIRNAAFYIKNTCPARANAECKASLEMLEIIEKETLAASSIIDELLDFAARRPLQKKKQNIDNLIDDSLKRIHTPENISVERKYAKKAAVAVDEKQLARVFINLTQNAVQAMPNGGTLTIATNETKDHVEIAFTDMGTGIQEENMSKLFSPLFTTKAKGIGMGLAICKKIVEQHGGTIEARSKAGQGTTFTIKLLKKEEANAQ